MMRLEELGSYVASAQDAEREALGATEKASASFVRALRRKPHPHRVPWAVGGAVGAMAAAATLAFFLRGPVAPPAITVAAGVTVGSPILAQTQDLPLSFSDGSQLTLLQGSRAAVRELYAEGANVELESGKTRVSVHHRSKTRWTLSAGPYRVNVTGTKFDLEWLPSRERFELTLEEGSVLVSTNRDSHATVRMAAAERLIIDHGQWQLSPSSAIAPQTASLPAATATSTVQEAPAVDANPTSPASPTVGSTAERTWQQWSKLGKFNEAYAKAATIGIPHLIQTSSAQSVLTLAEVCRFSGHAGEAVVALTRLRQRFENTDEAAVAAFQLGRLSQGEPAATWFQSYLRERPNGDLAREASGRLLEALDRAGNHTAAVEAANSYLLRYPSGPHARFAREIRGY